MVMLSSMALNNYTLKQQQQLKAVVLYKTIWSTKAPMPLRAVYNGNENLFLNGQYLNDYGLFFNATKIIVFKWHHQNMNALNAL